MEKEYVKKHLYGYVIEQRTYRRDRDNFLRRSDWESSSHSNKVYTKKGGEEGLKHLSEIYKDREFRLIPIYKFIILNQEEEPITHTHAIEHCFFVEGKEESRKYWYIKSIHKSELEAENELISKRYLENKRYEFRIINLYSN